MKKDTKFLLLLCILAALRVFVYSASFPFFGNVDEQAHFDLVLKYSNGHVPGSLEKLSPQAAYYIPRYESPEFFNKPTNLSDNSIAPPPWKRNSEEKMQRYYDEGVAYWSTNYTNHESSQAPVYYAIAGAWTNAGSFIGVKGGYLLYWIRFLNIFIVVALVLVAFSTGKILFPDNSFIALGLPMLVAFFPQDSYYAIQNDVLSPLFFGLAFLQIIRFVTSKLQNRTAGFLAGLFLALTVLVKVANLPLAVIALAFVMVHVATAFQKREQWLIPLLLFLVSLLVPLAIWIQWNLTQYGDLTASKDKIHVLGWTAKQFHDWFQHPIFTLHGGWIFIRDLLATFWRGELIWWNEPLAMPAADLFYVITSILFVLAGIINFRKYANTFQQKINWFSFLCFVSLIVFMAILSISFDFGNCENPSRAHPYFTSGRLITGALIPFLLLYLQGLNCVLSGIKNDKSRWLALILIVTLITFSEFIVNRPVFSGQYNFFHL